MTLKLIYKGEIVNHRTFTPSSKRWQIINNWKKLYGPLFKECILDSAEDSEEDEFIIVKSVEKSPFKKGILQKKIKINRQIGRRKFPPYDY